MSDGATLFIGVNYGTDELALRFVQSVRALEPAGRHIAMVVDNTPGERDGRLERELGALPGAAYLRAPRNLGYFGGAAFGLDAHRERAGQPDWVVVSNVDIEFRDRAFLRELVAMPKADLGVIAPSIWSSKSLRDLNPRLVVRPRRLTMKFYKVLFGNALTLNLYELLAAGKHVLKFVLRMAGQRLGHGAAESGASLSRPIYAPQGSCLVFARLFFDRGGSLRYPSFLFGEEIFVAETARELRLAVLYDPRLRVWHDDHASTGLIRSRGIARHVGESARYIADRYFA